MQMNKLWHSCIKKTIKKVNDDFSFYHKNKVKNHFFSVDNIAYIYNHSYQNGYSSEMLLKKTMAGVSLAMAFCIVFRKNLSFWSACSFEGKIFFHRVNRRLQKYFVYFKDFGCFCGRKDSFKNV